MSCSDSLPTAAGALAAGITQGRSEQEIALLAALFTQLGDSLALILAARDACGKSQPLPASNKQQTEAQAIS